MNWQRIKVSIRTSGVRLLNLNKEGDDWRFILCTGSVRSMCIVCMFHCTVRPSGAWGDGGLADLWSNEAEKERSGRGVGGHRSRPFPMEQAIGWSRRHV